MKSAELKTLFEEAKSGSSKKNYYIVENNLQFFQKEDKDGTKRKCLVVPEKYRKNLMTIGHEAAAAHLGVTKTKDAIFKTFYRPKCFSDVEDFVKTTDKCQLIDLILTSHCSATRGLLATDHVILNHGQVTWTTPELAPPLLTTTPHLREDVSALDRFNVHRCPTRRIFSGTGLELVTRQDTIRYLYNSATASTDKCQRVGKPHDKKKFPLKIVPVITEIFLKINIDASGPLPMTPSGNKYIITALCMSSRYPNALPVANLCSTTVVNALLQIFSRMGFPRELQTDQSTSFMSALTTEFLERFGVKVVRSSVYHPQSNPVERMHRTLKRILRVLCLEAIPDWEKILPQALFVLRTVIHDSTGFSPAELVHGKNLRTSVMLLYENLTEEEPVESSVVDYVFELINRMKRCQELAILHIEDAKQKQKL
ncbi:retrovirus-related Pol polyprotein from transposon 412 [Trichonephila clavipes]|nr:retrovirus-related Pol polyprotein from transposon 412 [Trichonephila clavipes]